MDALKQAGTHDVSSDMEVKTSGLDMIMITSYYNTHGIENKLTKDVTFKKTLIVFSYKSTGKRFIYIHNCSLNIEI